MTSTATALVQTAARQAHLEEFPLPSLHEPGSALLRVEANGLCFSDVDSFDGDTAGFRPDDLSQYPRINGHEIVGVIEDLGPAAPHRAGLKVGDRVAIHPFLPCGKCRQCLSGKSYFCKGWGLPFACYGYLPTRFAPALWGGYATHVYIHPNTILYPIPAHVGALTATLWNPLGGAIQWAVMNTGLTIGSTVAILGCGQRGLASVVACKAAGAGLIVTTGLSKDRHKLALAKEFGADAAIDVEQEDAVQKVLELTGGEGVDIVVDYAPHAVRSALDAVRMVRMGGVISLVGLKSRPVPDFPLDELVMRGIRVQGNLGQTVEAYRSAVGLVASGAYPLDRMRTHVFGIDEVERAMDVLAGKVPGENAINVVVTPTLGGSGR